MAHGNARHAPEHTLGLHQAAELGFGQVNLAYIARHHRLGAKANTREKHLHLLGRGVLRLVQNHKRRVQRAPAHEGQWGHFNRLALERFLHLLKAHQVVQRVVERAQVGVNFLVQVARQKAQALAGFYRWAGQHNALHGAALQSVYRHGYRQIRFARAGRANAKGNVVAGNLVQVGGLVQGARLQVAAFGFERGAVGGVHVGIACQHQLHHGRLNRAGRHFIHGLQHFHAAFGVGLGAVHLELLVAVRNLHLERRLNGAQMRVHGATQMRQAGVVGRGKQVSENQVDNS